MIFDVFYAPFFLIPDGIAFLGLLIGGNPDIEGDAKGSAWGLRIFHAIISFYSLLWREEKNNRQRYIRNSYKPWRIDFTVYLYGKENTMSDTIITVNSPDPVKAFEAMARIMGDKERMDIVLKGLKKTDEREMDISRKE